MPYVTRPYLFAGVGHNPLWGVREYVVEPGRLTIHYVWRIHDVVELTEEPLLEPLQSAADRLLDRGGLVIKTSARTIVCSRVRNLKAFAAALRGSHPDILEDLRLAEEKEREEKRFASLSEDDLEDIVLFYPKYPRCIVDIFDAHPASPFGRKTLDFRVVRGDFVRKGQVIASCGRFELTAPHEGRVAFLGNAAASVAEWPRKRQLEDLPEDLREEFYTGSTLLNVGALVPDEDVDPADFYAFSLRPTKHAQAVSEDTVVGSIRYAFDHGLASKDALQGYPSTFFHLVDDVVGGLEGVAPGRVTVPDHVANDPQAAARLRETWAQLNHTRPGAARPGELPA